ncbi:hypothetical protein [Sporichthya polymorpha]|uniref:hypothetical protein n=1 Tax=Sporichthya polymorpha TaxID=35751 RepID=UPI00036ABFF3|nr:hypothetical protein [Sporichthya polymorpha]
MSVIDTNNASRAAELEAENARADARGIAFLAVMAVAGALTVAATLTLATPSGSPAGASAKPGTPTAPVAAAR